MKWKMSPNEGQLDLDNKVVLFTGTIVPVFLPGGRQASAAARTEGLNKPKPAGLMHLHTESICFVSIKKTYKVGHLYKVSSWRRFHWVGALAGL